MTIRGIEVDAVDAISNDDNFAVQLDDVDMIDKEEEREERDNNVIAIATKSVETVAQWMSPLDFGLNSIRVHSNIR